MWRLKVDLPPHMKKGRLYYMDDETGLIYMVENGRIATYPSRKGIAGYLWYLRLYGHDYLEPVEESDE